MGIDLVIYPLRGISDLGRTDGVCVLDVLYFIEDYKLFGQLTDMSEAGYEGPTPSIQTNTIPPRFKLQLFNEEGLRETREDELGKELTYAFAKDLKGLELGEKAHPKNKAIKAYIDALPDDIPIILVWR